MHGSVPFNAYGYMHDSVSSIPPPTEQVERTKLSDGKYIETFLIGLETVFFVKGLSRDL